MTEPSASDNVQTELVASLRRYGAAHAALMRSFADHLSMNTTDAAALSEILFAADMGQPLTPAELAQRVGRSRPATTAILARLLAAGVIRREPHPHDGRAAILLAGSQIEAAIPAFFQALSGAMSARLARHDPRLVRELITLLDDTTECIVAETPKI